MANYGLLAGLGAAMQDFGKIGLKEWSDNEDELRDAKKMQLKNKLDMDLMKAKYDFMKANPRYKQFFTDPSGNRIGVDEQGNEKMVHEATAEEAADAKATREGKIAYTQALADAAKARAENAGATTASTNLRNLSQAELNKARTAHVGDPKGGDKSILTPADWDTKVENEVKRSMGLDEYKNAEPEDLSTARDKAAEKLRTQGYTRGFQGKAAANSGLGAFGNAPGLSGGGAGGGLLSVGGGDEETAPDQEDDSDLDD